MYAEVALQYKDTSEIYEMAYHWFPGRTSNRPYPGTTEEDIDVVEDGLTSPQ